MVAAPVLIDESTGRARLPQTALAAALALVGRAANERSPLPVTSHIYLAGREDGLELRATNLDVAIATTIATPGPVALDPVCVPARSLIDFVAALPAGDVAVAADEKRATLESGRLKAQLRVVPGHEFPPIPRLPEDAAEVFLPTAVLREAIDQVATHAARDESRPVLAGVLVRIEAERLTFAAADGFRLALREVEAPGLGEMSVILPARNLRELRRLLGEDAPETVALALSTSTARFTVGPTAFYSRLIEGAFPNYQVIVPESTSTDVVADVATLRAVLDAIAPLADRGLHAVRIAVGKGGLHLRCRSVDLGEAEAVVMAETSGEPLVIGVGLRYLDDALASCRAESVRIGMNTASTAIVFRSEPGLTVCVMPMTGVASQE